MSIKPLPASLVQLVERRSPKPDVEGSSPSGRELLKGNKMNDTVNSIIAYLKAVRLEWSKINWPERRQVIAETVFVIVIVFALTVSVYLLDIIFKAVLGLIPTR